MFALSPCTLYLVGYVIYYRDLITEHGPYYT